MLKQANKQADEPSERDSTKSKAHHGTFTQLPNVLLDTCDITDEALMLFSRLLRHVGHRGGVFVGSIRKMATTVQGKRDKIHRNFKALERAGLITLGQDFAVILNTDELWELNIAYTNGIEIPRWTNLQEILKSVRETGQTTEETASEISDNVSHISDKLSQKSDRIVRETGQTVRPPERKIPPNTIKTVNKEKERETPPVPPSPQRSSLSLSPEKKSLMDQLTNQEVDFWARWCAIGGAQELNETAHKWVIDLAPKTTTTAELQSLYNYDYERLQEFAKAQGRTATPPNLCNLAKRYNEWRTWYNLQKKEQDQEAREHIPGSGSITNWTQARLAGNQPTINYEPLPPVKKVPKDLKRIGNVTSALSPELQERFRQAREKRQTEA